MFNKFNCGVIITEISTLSAITSGPIMILGLDC